MSYQVLARKYRPQIFEDVVGQEHVTQTLKNAILKERLHHAYVLTGVRGTGKTSLARILAKALNCEQGPTPTPCGTCSNCLAITSGQFLDVHEIDGASNTSVESVRELREQVKYMPAAGKYKVYIIDEVHMLSTSAFNALLKTLEEPPPHVLFIFATTEVHKIPVTILSRCQRFDLRRISQEKIKSRLQEICQKESVEPEGESLELLARAAEGSMRDSLSLLDMAIGLCGDQLSAQPIREMLGFVPSTWIQEITQECLKGQLQEALQRVREIYQRGTDLYQLVVQWVEYWHDLALVKAAGPQSLQDKLSTDELEMMNQTVASVDLQDLQVIFQMVYRAAEQIFRSDSPKLLLDLLLVKIIHGSPFQSLKDVIADPTNLAVAGPGPSADPPRSIPKTSSVAKAPPSPKGVSPTQKSVMANSPQEALAAILKKRPQVKAMLDHAKCHWEGHRLLISLEAGSMWVDLLKERRADLQQALQEKLSGEVKIEIQEDLVQASASEAPAETLTRATSSDPIVQQAVKILNATIKEVKSYGHEQTDETSPKNATGNGEAAGGLSAKGL